MAALTIDELAATTGLTARNIRSYQTRGLLPGPQLRGRVAYYGDEHLARLEMIKQMQADGLSLKLVERLVNDRARASNQLRELRNRVITGLNAAGGETTSTVEELVARFGDFGGTIIAKAVEIGALVPRDDGLIGVPYPELLDTAERTVEQGVSLEAALDMAAAVRRNCEDAARVFVGTIMQQVWEPFAAAGRPDDELQEVAAKIDRLAPLASEIFDAMLLPTIAAEVDRAFGRYGVERDGD